jgi:hypothetical protein
LERGNQTNQKPRRERKEKKTNITNKTKNKFFLGNFIFLSRGGIEKMLK